MPIINPYINFNGNALEAFNFYKSIFGGEFTKIKYFKDLMGPDFDISDADANKIMDIRLPIGDNLLIANDVPEILGRVNEKENRSKISITAESIKEADKLFYGLSQGGTIEMPICDGFLGYFGAFRDKFGIEWTIEYTPNQKN
jgi:PhnB protein